jgi:hypothetical protein
MQVQQDILDWYEAALSISAGSVQIIVDFKADRVRERTSQDAEGTNGGGADVIAWLKVVLEVAKQLPRTLVPVMEPDDQLGKSS